VAPIDGHNPARQLLLRGSFGGGRGSRRGGELRSRSSWRDSSRGGRCDSGRRGRRGGCWSCRCVGRRSGRGWRSCGSGRSCWTSWSGRSGRRGRGSVRSRGSRSWSWRRIGGRSGRSGRGWRGRGRCRRRRWRVGSRRIGRWHRLIISPKGQSVSGGQRQQQAEDSECFFGFHGSWQWMAGCNRRRLDVFAVNRSSLNVQCTSRDCYRQPKCFNEVGFKLPAAAGGWRQSLTRCVEGEDNSAMNPVRFFGGPNRFARRCRRSRAGDSSGRMSSPLTLNRRTLIFG
jgi:hypothetical protein